MASSSRNQIKDSADSSFCGPVLPLSIPPRSLSHRFGSPVSERYSTAWRNCIPYPFSQQGFQKTMPLPKSSGDELRKLAIKNSIIKMGGKAAEVAELTLIIVKPSHRDQLRHRRRHLASYKPRLSRLSLMSKAEEYVPPENIVTEIAEPFGTRCWKGHAFHNPKKIGFF